MKKNLNSNFKKIWLLLVPVLLILIPGMVFAATGNISNSTSPTGVTLQSFSIPPTDMSVAFLARIFGTVGGGLVGGATIFGQIFYVFNWGVLMIAGMILTYTTGRSIMEIANADGGQSSRKFSWYVPVRVVLGVALLVPQATGYSTLNSMVMWITLQGVGLADAVWSQSIDFLQKGGAIYTPPASDIKAKTDQQLDDKIVDSFESAPKNSGTSVGVASILRSQICMQALYKHLNGERSSAASNIQDQINTKLAVAKAEYTDKGVVVPAVINTQIAVLKKSQQELSSPLQGFNETCGSSDSDMIKFPCNAQDTTLNGVCGAYKWLPVLPATSTDKKSGEDAYASAKKNGLQQVVLGLSQFADDVVNKYKDSDFDNFVTVTDKYKGDAKNPMAPYTDDAYSQQKLVVTSGFPSFSRQVYEEVVTEAGAYQEIVYPMRAFAANDYTSGGIMQKTSTTSINVNDNGFSQTTHYSYDSNAVDLAEVMRSQGWVTAGSYYFALMSVNAVKKIDNDYYRFYATTLPPCKGAGSDSGCLARPDPKLTTALGGVNSIDNASLDKRLTWVGSGNSLLHAIAKDAHDLVGELNKAISTSTTVNLPDELQNFVKNRQINISTGAYSGALWGGDAAAMGLTALISAPFGGVPVSTWVFGRLNQGLANVFIVWGNNLGINPASTTRNFSPVIRLQKLGETMIIECMNIWNQMFNALNILVNVYFEFFKGQWYASLGISALSAMGISIGAEQWIQLIVSGVQEVLRLSVEMPMAVSMPIVIAVTSLMATTGVVLAYYIPMLPFMFFIFGVVGWLAFVIEAMVAAPIVALGITHPDGGHDLLGKAEAAVMLLLSVFIRPAAMIIGLISAIVVSYVALDVLDTGFGTIIKGMYYSDSFNINYTLSFWNMTFASTNSSTLNGVSSQVVNSAMILVYVLIAMAVVQQCFSLIHIIPSRILHWIGGQGEGGMDRISEQLAGKVEGGLSQAAGSITQAYGSGAGAIKGNMAFGGKSVPKSEGDDKAGDASQSPGASAGGGGSGTPPAGGAAGGTPPVPL